MIGADGARSAREVLLDTAVEMLEERGPDAFTVEEVLIESNTSSSSLYHHFGSREGLLTAARRESYRRLARREDRNNLAGGQNATTPAEFLAYVAGQVERVVTDPDNRVVRRTRFEVAARALGCAELAAQMGEVQERMFGEVIAMFDDAQARGLINPDLDTRAYVFWFHDMVLGRTATEAVAGSTEAWLSVAVPAMLAPLRIASA